MNISNSLAREDSSEDEPPDLSQQDFYFNFNFDKESYWKELVKSKL